MFADPRYNNQAFYGLQNLNFVMNIGDTSRVWRTSAPITGTTAAAGAISLDSVAFKDSDAFSGSQLHFMFLTPHPSDLLPARNICPYYELPRYITPIKAVAANTASTQYSQSLQLNQIPDKLIFAIRKAMGKQNNHDTDSYLPITGCSIQFNNNAGILSSATQYELFDMSVKNGSNQTWYEFSGSAYSASSSTNKVVNTSGSVVILEFGRDIQLVEDYYAPGSIGNYNLQIKVDFLNNTNVAIDNSANEYELVLITMNSGVFVCERGTSQVFTGILSKSDVLEASSGEVYTRSDVQRMVGGGFFDTIKSIAGSVKDAIAPIASVLGPVAKTALSAMPDPRAQMAAKALGAIGMGQSGGKRDPRLM